MFLSSAISTMVLGVAAAGANAVISIYSIYGRAQQVILS